MGTPTYLEVLTVRSSGLWTNNIVALLALQYYSEFNSSFKIVSYQLA